MNFDDSPKKTHKRLRLLLSSMLQVLSMGSLNKLT